MASDPIKPLLDQALALLRENRPQDALKILDQIGEPGIRIPDQLSYRGLANAKLGNQAEAERLLRAAVDLAPTECRHRFTLSIQLRETGNLAEAKEQARTARKIDPKFPGINELYASLGLDPASEPKPTLRDRLFAPPLENPAYGQFHAFPSLEHSAKQWTITGWVLVALSFLPLLVFRFHLPIHMPAGGEAKGLPILGGMAINSDPLSAFMIFLLVTVAILSALWMVTDMLDRRARVLWIIPFIPFCCLCAMPGVGQGLYMGLGRK